MAYTDYDLKRAFRQWLGAAGFSAEDADSAATELVDQLDITNLSTSGAITAGTGLTATTGGVTATAGGLTVTAGGANVVAGDVTIDDNVTVTNGNVTITAGGLEVTAGAVNVAAGEVAADSVNVTANGLTVTAGDVTIDDNVTVTNGDVTITAGELVVTAGNAVIGDASSLNTTSDLQVIDGDASVINTGTLGAECLDETDFATHAAWDVTNDWDDSGGNAEYTWSASQTSTLTQTSANLATAIKGNRWYKLVYTVTVTTAPDGDSATTLTTGIAASAQTLDVTAGTKTVYFKTKASPGDFVISTTDSTGTEGQFAIDDISLKEVIDGDLYLGGDLTANVATVDKLTAVTNGVTVTSGGVTITAGGLDVNAGTTTANAGLIHGTSAFTTAGPTDDLDVTNVSVLLTNTTGAAIVIGGFANGVAGQILHVVAVADGSNTVTLEHAEAGGSQDIYLASAADEAVTYGGWTLICDGTSWFACGGPSDATGA